MIFLKYNSYKYKYLPKVESFFTKTKERQPLRGEQETKIPHPPTKV